MVTSMKTAPHAPVAGDRVYSMLDDLRGAWDVLITDKAVTITGREDGHSFGYNIQDGRMDRAIARAWAGEPPDFR